MHIHALSIGVRIRNSSHLNIQNLQHTRTCEHRASRDSDMSFDRMDTLALYWKAPTAQGCASRSALVSEDAAAGPNPISLPGDDGGPSEQ